MVVKTLILILIQPMHEDTHGDEDIYNQCLS